jgi:hypothetical protein
VCSAARAGHQVADQNHFVHAFGHKQIQEQCRIDCDEDDDNQPDLFPFDDVIPF